MEFRYIIVLLIFTISVGVQAQEKYQSKSSSLKQKEAVMEVSKSLEENKSDEELARDYEKLAKEFTDAANYTKAEENWEKAKKIYQKLKNKEKIAAVERELAKIQESQKKYDVAISNYNSAAKFSKNDVQKRVNTNDANRLINKSNPQVQSKYIRENIELLEATDQSEEKAVAYQQMADVNLALDQKDEAISNYENAINEVKNKPEEVVKIKREIANVYAKEQEYDKAIEINEGLVKEAKDNNNPKAEIEQLQKLSEVYVGSNEPKKGIKALEEAYSLAIEDANTLEAKKSVELLVEQYRKTNNTKKTLELYSDFMNKLESLLASDSSLIDAKTIISIENRISQLEKERMLQDELIRRKNVLNYILFGFIALILVFVAFIVKALYAINVKNKKIALQSLRREMNPHFIFNSLNSVNQFIAQNNELEANKYLTSYSKLMRNIMENSNKDFIPLSVELAQLKEYLQLEYMRFSNKFTYEIDVDPALDADVVLVPNMLIQPQLENAIWHGLRYRDSQGKLLLKIVRQNDELQIIIDDNGIGLKKSQELKTKHQKQHQSRGMSNTHERVSLLNDLYHTHIEIKVAEKTGEESGVIVRIDVPTLK